MAIKQIDHFVPKKSVNANQAPTSDKLVIGELAVNAANGTERIYMMNASSGIIPFSSDEIIKKYVDEGDEKVRQYVDDSNAVVIDSIINTVLMDMTAAKGYDVSNPTLISAYGSKESLNMVLKHYKMGLFKDGKLVKEMAPCRLTKAKDGSDINIDGTDGDVMIYTDTSIYRDRCNVSGVTIPDSTATTHNMIGLGLIKHQFGGKQAKEMKPFAFAPHYASIGSDNAYHCCYNKTMTGSGGSPFAMYTSNFIGANGAQGGYPRMYQSAATSMQLSRRKGDGYIGIFYEFYEMWMIAMYLELGSLYFTSRDSFGEGCTYSTPSKASWYGDVTQDGTSGIRIIMDSTGDNDHYSALMDYNYRIGQAVGSTDDGKIRPIMGILGYNYYNFTEQLEAQRLVDAVVRDGLTDKVDGVTLLEYTEDGTLREVSGVNVSNGEGMEVDKKYYTVRNVPKCQGISDGVMTCVVNSFVKTTFAENVYHGQTNVGGKTVIFKFSHPMYRGLTLFDGAFTQIEGIHHVMGNYGGTRKGSIMAVKDFTDMKYDPSSFKSADYSVKTDVADEDIPWLSGYTKVGEYTSGNSGWVKNTNYDVSLYCHTECGGAANRSNYECGYVWRYGSSWGGANTTDGYPNDGYKNVNASVVGCDAFNGALGRTLYANRAVAHGYDFYAGGFALGTPLV